MFGLGPVEIIIILVLGLLLFGNQLPALARTLGKTIAEVRQETNGLSDDLRGPGGRRA